MDDYKNFNNNDGVYYQPPKPQEPEQTSAPAEPEAPVQQSQPVQQSTFSQNYSAGNSQPGSYTQYSQPYTYNQPNGYSTYGSQYIPPAQTHKKKNKTAKTIAIVLAVCIIIAGCFGIGSAVNRSGNGNSLPFGDNSSSADTGDDVKLHESADVEKSDKDGNLTVAGVAEECMDSCVGITVYAQQSSYDYFYGYGGSSSENGNQKAGEGSGIIMKEYGGKSYILTCAHVISGGDSYTVTLNDGTELEATFVGADAQTDIGVLSVDKTGLEIAEFADSAELEVGEQVVAIGCPGGLEFINSVTSGYISALSRPVSSSIGYDNECIQTDAAINPGNSGGALFNMQGQVVGVNSSKIASTEYEGMGFAVPSSTAIATANSLIANGYVAGRVKLGINYSPISGFTNANAILSALAEKGYKDAKGTMVINNIDSDSDLADKDIRQYDMIVAVNGDTLTSIDVMTSLLASSSVGDTVTLTIARIEGNSISTFDVECELIESKG